MISPRLKLVVWDMDGTLVDSRDVIRDCMDEAFEAFGLEPPGYERTRQIVGLSLDEACRRLAPQLEQVDLHRLVEAYKDGFISRRSRPDFEEPLYEGAVEALKALQDEGWLQAVATGKSRRGLNAVFDHHGLGSFFDAALCADDGPGKPHPFMIEECLARLGASAGEALMVGDTAHDMEMARSAGVRGEGVAWGFHTRDEIVAGGADHVSETFAELMARLRHFGAGLARTEL